MANPGNVTLQCQSLYRTDAVYMLYFKQKASHNRPCTCIKSSIMSNCYTIPLISDPNREVSGGLDSTAVTLQYRRGGCPLPTSVPECSDSHELETLMPSGSQESGQPLEEAPEEQSLMASANPGEGEDNPAPEPKVKTCWGKLSSTLALYTLLFFF